MKNIYEHSSLISRLIVKEITQSINDEEKMRLNVWRQESPENELLYQKLHDSHFHKGQYKKINEYDTHLALKEMHLRIKGKKKKKKLYIISIAAAVVLALVIGRFALFENNLKSVKTNQITRDIVTDNKEVILQLSDGSLVSLDTINKLEEKGTVLSKTGNRILEYNSTHADSDGYSNELVYNEIIVPRGADYDLILSDGTKVKLNAGSRLRFPVDFKKENRMVMLDGEGYFSVTKDIEHPFIVETANQFVKVLGTEFNINGYSDENKVYTTLVEGTVNVSIGDQNVLMSPGEQSVINKQGKSIVKRKVDVNQYISWKDGYFVLEDQTLDVIMKKFERWYDINVVYSDNSIKNVIFKGQIPRSTSLNEALLIIEKTADLYFKVEDREVTIYLTR